MLQNLQNCARFQKFQLDNLVDFENCCKTRIFLQKSVPIQPKTSNILPKICPDRSRPVAAAAARRARAPAEAAADAPPAGSGRLGLGKLANFWRTCSRLYQNQILQENVRLTAFFKLYKMCIRDRSCVPPAVAIFRQNVARFRLYRHRFLQENTRFAAFFKIYQIF